VFTHPGVGASVPGLVASFLSAMLQEHERGVGGWQAEWPVVAAVIQSTGVAIAQWLRWPMGSLLTRRRCALTSRIRTERSFAERAMMLLGAKLGRDVAHNVVEAAVRKSVKEAGISLLSLPRLLK